MNTDGVVKLADFGVSSSRSLVEDNRGLESFTGTSFYMSPERIRGLTYYRDSDIWSLGISIFDMSTGIYPYYYTQPPDAAVVTPSSSRNLFNAPVLELTRVDSCVYGEGSRRSLTTQTFCYTLHMIVGGGEPVLPIAHGWSTELHDFLRLCIRKDHTMRASATELLQHPFIAIHCKELVSTAQQLKIADWSLVQQLEHIQPQRIFLRTKRERQEQPPLTPWGEL